ETPAPSRRHQRQPAPRRTCPATPKTTAATPATDPESPGIRTRADSPRAARVPRTRRTARPPRIGRTQQCLVEQIRYSSDASPRSCPWPSGRPAEPAGEATTYQSRFGRGFLLPTLDGRRQSVTTFATAVTRKS